MIAKAEELQAKFTSLFETGDYEQLKTIIPIELEKYNSSQEKDVFILTEIAGAFISLGTEIYDKDSVEIGLKLFSDNRKELTGQITEASIEYCLGNAFGALYMFSAQEERIGQHWYITPELVKGDLFEAKQCYLRAFKLINIRELDDLSIQILTNLASNLNQSGRIVEALQLFDMVLKYNPNFPQALIGKADTLCFMISRTYCGRSISLFAEVYFLFIRGLEQNLFIPPDIQTSININLEHCIKALKDLNFNFEDVINEFELNEQEYKQHSIETKFYLDNFLGMSEHSLYCKCNEAKTDDLFIGFPGLEVTNRKVAELEHLLNRIKSEFSFARKQLFEFSHSDSTDNMFYQDFGVHQLIYGVKNEKLRISFRMCFGILDKIAQGILYLYDLEKGNNENTYFESFWKNAKAPAGRWEKFNEVKNTHLTALYSIACDLSKYNGEFSYYKKWRNQLEHDVFSMVPLNMENQDVLESDLLSEWTTEKDFEEKSLHLLQLVRAAIFSFAFCCREELVK
jgi:tetratricopeptide (TPR) repeat protein